MFVYLFVHVCVSLCVCVYIFACVCVRPGLCVRPSVHHLAHQLDIFNQKFSYLHI